MAASSKKQRYGWIEESEDRISQLPELLLLHILSFSQTKDAFSICLASKRWLSLWTFADSFNFTSQDFVKPENSNISFVEYALAHSVTPRIKKLKFGLTYSSNFDQFQSIINRCLSFASEKNVEDVVIWSDLFSMCSLPQSFCTCSSLVTLVVSRVWVKFDGVIEWKSLKSLNLKGSMLSGDGDVVNLLAGCPALETLAFSETRGFRRLEIKSLKLKRLIFAGCRLYKRDEPMEIFAPYLQHLEISGKHDLEDLNFRLIDVSSVVEAKLTFSITCIKYILASEGKEFNNEEDSCHDYHQASGILIRDNLQKLSTTTKLIIGAWLTDALCMLQLKGVPIPELKCKYLTVKSHIQKLNLYGVAGLLKASPHLETLNINMEISFYHVLRSHCHFWFEYLAFRDDFDLLSTIPSFVFPNLKSVTIDISFKSCKWDRLKWGFDMLFKLLEFLLKTTTSLEELIIIPNKRQCSCVNYCKTVYLQKLAEKLLDCQRSSTKSEIIFKE